MRHVGVTTTLSRSDQGDFSLDKVFYTAAGVRIVFDLGVSQVFRDLMGPSRSIYASRQVLSGAAPTLADDYFSVAVVSYELLTGRHPYQEMTADDVFSSTFAVEPIASISDEAWQTLSSMLSLQTAPAIEHLRRLAAAI